MENKNINPKIRKDIFIVSKIDCDDRINFSLIPFLSWKSPLLRSYQANPVLVL